jgi:hypothetical protein
MPYLRIMRRPKSKYREHHAADIRCEVWVGKDSPIWRRWNGKWMYDLPFDVGKGSGYGTANTLKEALVLWRLQT